MKVPLSWLKKHLVLDKSHQEISEMLTLLGLEVDKTLRVDFPFSGVVIVKILEVTPHPNASGLKLVIATDGQKKYQIVSNEMALSKETCVPLAKPKATFFFDGKSVEVEKVKIKGIESQGKFLSEKELGLSSNHDSIMRLPPDAPVGEDLTTYLYDPTFDIALTPNLGHCRNILGIARELASAYNLPKTQVTPLPKPSFKEDSDNPISTKIEVSNESDLLCPQYYLRMIQGVEIGPSPPWLKSLLEKAGLPTINNVVDVTNYVMHDIGQPLHAFDYEKILENSLSIRTSLEGETITTLDGEKRDLPLGTLVICDGDAIAAIAGIMGGLESSITSSTHTILLESAQFSPLAIRKASKALGLRTEASARFENGVDPTLQKFALDYAASLIQEIAGGSVLKGVVNASSHPYLPRFITCRLSKINALLGLSLTLSEVEAFLTRLHFAYSSDGPDLFQLKVPPFRNDITSEIDVVEEIGRLYGYNNLPKEAPRHTSSKESDHPLYTLENEVRKRLIACNLQEFMNCNLISPSLCNSELESGLFSSEYIRVLHAKSEDQSILRPSLLPGLLLSLKTNQNHKRNDVAAFEIGRVHFQEGGRFDERCVVGILLAGKRAPHHWDTPPLPFDFYDLKGVIESLLTALGIKGALFSPSTFTTFHPGGQAKLAIGEEIFGVLGELHPATREKLDLREPIFFAELDLHTLLKHRTLIATFSPLPELPSSTRDWTVTLKRSLSLAPLFASLAAMKSPLLKEYALLDIYTGEKISKEEKNVTFRFVYRDDTQTIQDEKVQEEHERILHTLERLLT